MSNFFRLVLIILWLILFNKIFVIIILVWIYCFFFMKLNIILWFVVSL